MKYLLVTTIIVIFFSFSAECQLDKGNWLFGGNASFSSIQTVNNFVASTTNNNIQVAGNAGYFFINKLAGGLKPNLLLQYNKTSTGNLSQNISSIGPFIRYYFFPIEGRVNFFAEGSYVVGISKVSTTGINNYSNSYQSSSYSFVGGPVIFLNSSVALEISFGYTHLHSEANNLANTLELGIGLQFHLEKEKSNY